MRAVWYYEVTRRRDNFIRMILTPVILLFVVFVLSFLMDAMVPVVNRVYMKWPDMVKDLLSLPAWNSNLYVNLWQLFALFYPIIFLYNVVSGLTASIIEEERLETVTFLHNLSVNRLQVLFGKLLVWCAVLCLSLLALLVENIIFFLIVGANNMLGAMVEHYLVFLFVGILYSIFAVFLASYHKTELDCEDTISTVMILTFLFARIYTLIQFLSDLFVATGREGAITERMDIIAQKLRILTVASPLTWCWPGVAMDGVYALCGVIVAVILLVAAGYIYPRRTFTES